MQDFDSRRTGTLRRAALAGISMLALALAAGPALAQVVSATGDVLPGGVTSPVWNPSEIRVGDTGTGTLTIEDGGTVPDDRHIDAGAREQHAEHELAGPAPTMTQTVLTSPAMPSRYESFGGGGSFALRLGCRGRFHHRLSNGFRPAWCALRRGGIRRSHPPRSLACSSECVERVALARRSRSAMPATKS